MSHFLSRDPLLSHRFCQLVSEQPEEANKRVRTLPSAELFVKKRLLGCLHFFLGGGVFFRSGWFVFCPAFGLWL